MAKNRSAVTLVSIALVVAGAATQTACTSVRALAEYRSVAREAASEISLSPEEQNAEAVKTVEDFYSWYLGYPGNVVADGAHRSSEYLTAAFVEQVDELVASFTQGGYDPFLCAQDIPGDLIVDETVVSGEQASVVIHEVWNAGTDFEMVHDVVVELQRIGGAWKIADITLQASDDGGQVELRRGQNLVVSLRGNVTTGYTWEAAAYDERILRQVGETPFTPQSAALGAPGRQFLRFEGLDEGQTTLQLVYHRPWEDAEPEKVFSVAVVVR